MRVKLVVTFVCLLAACGDRPGEKAKAKEPPRLPRITHFYGNQTVVPKGGSVTLCYGTENVDTVTLSPSADPELRPSLNRCVAESPAKDTTYTLSVKGPGGETSETFSVRIGAPEARERALIQSFDVLGHTPLAKGEKVQLCYSTEAGATVSVSPAAAQGLAGGKNQCFDVSPAATTTYVLTARTASGSIDRMQVTVPVLPVQ